MALATEWTPDQVHATLDDLYSNGVPTGGDLEFALEVALRALDSLAEPVIELLIDEAIAER